MKRFGARHTHVVKRRLTANGGGEHFDVAIARHGFKIAVDHFQCIVTIQISRWQFGGANAQPFGRQGLRKNAASHTAQLRGQNVGVRCQLTLTTQCAIGVAGCVIVAHRHV